jgi:hypothetical protein
MKNWNEVKSSVNAFVDGVGERVRENKETLIRGSVLDPLNHPSYSPEKVAFLKIADATYEKSLARLNAKHGR